MRVLHATGYYFPDSTGGTEVYLDGLTRELSAVGCESMVLAPSRDMTESAYDWRGVPVRRFPWSHGGRREIISGNEPHLGFDRFEEILATSGATVYHQHAWSGGCGAQHLRAAKALGMRTVVTVHVPGFSCLAGTMMREGKGPCDGRIDALRCGTCWGVVRKGLPAEIARPALRLALGARSLGGPVARLAARATAAFDAHRRHFDTLLECSDRIVAVCDWLRDALLLNGVRADRLVSYPTGIDAVVGNGTVLPPAGESMQGALPGRLLRGGKG